MAWPGYIRGVADVDPGLDLKGGPPFVAAGERLAPTLIVVRHLNRSKHCDVYEVIDEKRGGGRYAAKVVRPDQRGYPAAVERILIEGVRLALAAHPSVLRCINTIDEPPGNLLEFIDGHNLNEVLHRVGRLPWREVARLGAQMASALVAVHESGLLHCDVKPANILVAGERYILIDLDLARPPGPANGGRGTRQFMAPEQAAGGTLGPEIDAWGLGITLFRAATGHHAFNDREGYPQTEFQAHPVADARPGAEPIAAIIDALLSPMPKGRPLLGWVAGELERQMGLQE